MKRQQIGCGLIFAMAGLILTGLWWMETGRTDPARDAWHDRLHAFYQRIDRQVNSGSIVILGDSHVQGFCAGCLEVGAVGFGFGKGRISTLKMRVSDYQSVKQARVVVLQIGHNDLPHLSNAALLAELLALLKTLSETPVLLVSQFPVDEHSRPDLAGVNERKHQMNIEARKLCSERPNCRFVDMTAALMENRTGPNPNLYLSDGIHLSTLGNKAWKATLKQAIDQIAGHP